MRTASCSATHCCRDNGDCRVVLIHRLYRIEDVKAKVRQGVLLADVEHGRGKPPLAQGLRPIRADLLEPVVLPVLRKGRCAALAREVR